MGQITTLNLLVQSFTVAESLLFYFIVMVLGVKNAFTLPPILRETNTSALFKSSQ